MTRACNIADAIGRDGKLILCVDRTNFGRKNVDLDKAGEILHVL